MQELPAALINPIVLRVDVSYIAIAFQMFMEPNATRPPRRGARRRCRHVTRFSRAGTAVMEAALAIPLLVSLVFGMVEFAQFYHTKSVFQGAAREGARAGVPWNATVAQIQSAVTTTLQPAGLPTGATYTVSVANASGSTISDLSTLSSGSTFTVTVSANWGDVGAGFRPLSLISSTKQVISTCTMKKEY